MKNKVYTSADLLAESIANYDIQYAFTVPGAKIDKLLNSMELRAKNIKIIPTRNEQNAVFIATGIYRITKKPQLVITTSAAGAGNTFTGMLTALQDGDAVIVIGAETSSIEKERKVHQVLNNKASFVNVTKQTYEIAHPDVASEVFANAYMSSVTGSAGPVFISLPYDVANQETNVRPLNKDKIQHLIADKNISNISEQKIALFLSLFQQSKFPVIFLGSRASYDNKIDCLRHFIEGLKIPIITTFQATGLISKEKQYLYFGRIGLVNNRSGNELINRSDLIISIGYNQYEESPDLINPLNNKKIINIDLEKALIHNNYLPDLEIIGDLELNFATINEKILPKIIGEDNSDFNTIFTKGDNNYLLSFKKKIERYKDQIKWKQKEKKIHPINIIKHLEKTINFEDTVLSCDVGSIYLWMSTFFRLNYPNRLLFCNGVQTLGVGLPWGIATSLLNMKAVSMSGDGGFQFSMAEFKTAVQYKLKLIHIIWNDDCYNMVKLQQDEKYHLATAVNVDALDFATYAKACGGRGYNITSLKNFMNVFDKEYKATDNVPVIINVNIDYSDNVLLLSLNKDRKLDY